MYEVFNEFKDVSFIVHRFSEINDCLVADKTQVKTLKV